MNDSFCRRCNMDLIGTDNMKVDEYSFCMSCMVQNEKDKLNKAIEALEFYACETNWMMQGFLCPEAEADSGKIARETLDEIRKRSINLDREEHLRSFKKNLTGIINKFVIKYPIIYDEYGAGARLISSCGALIADFEDHIDAETFMELIDEIRNWSTDLRGEETKESQDKEVEKME